MKIIVVGAGTIGRTIISSLVDENHEIVCIDIDQNKINTVINNFDVLGIVGSGTDKNILEEADIKNSDILISTTPSDELNIVNCLLAKKLGVKQTVARIKSIQYNRSLKLLRDMGINLAINPEKEAAEEILKIIEIPEAFEVNNFDKDICLINCLIQEDSKLLNLSLEDIKNRFNINCLFAAISRENEIIIPNGKTIINANDSIYLIGKREYILDFFDALDLDNKKIKNIMIVEGGNITNYFLDKVNKSKHKIKVFDSNKERCLELSERYSKIEFINEDGTVQESLIEQGIDNVDAFISLADIDEENILTSLFAKNKNITKIIAKVTRNNLSNIASTTKFASIISPKQLIADKIISYVRSIDNPYGSNVERLYSLVDGQIEAIEFKISEECKFLNIPLKELKIKKDILISSIIRNDEVITPNGNDYIENNDKVIIISKESLSDINEIIK